MGYVLKSGVPVADVMTGCADLVNGCDTRGSPHVPMLGGAVGMLRL